MNIFFNLLQIRVIRFMIVGFLNTTFSYCIYAFFLFTGLNYAISNLLALISGIFFSFRTQGVFVFKNSSKYLFGRFVVAWVIIYFFNIFFIWQLIELGLNSYTSGALAIIPVATLSYFFQKFFVFRYPILT
jgi:putative flippase GtrA